MPKKANSTKSCGIAWTPYSKNSAKLLPTIITSASLSYCCRKTSVSALSSSPESGLTREKQYILERSDTERLYCVETSPSHLSTNQLLFPCTSTYVGLCGWFWSRSCVSSVSASHLSFSQVNLKNQKNIWKTSDFWLDPRTQFWTHLLGQCINPEVLYTLQHATTLETNFDSCWTCIFIVSVQGSTETKTRKVGKKSFLRVGNL